MNLKILTVAVLFSLVGCGKPADKAPEASRPEPEKPSTVAARTPPRDSIVQACVKQHSETHLKYCECYADQLTERAGGAASQEERGRAAVAAAMACKGLRAP